MPHAHAWSNATHTVFIAGGSEECSSESDSEDSSSSDAQSGDDMHAAITTPCLNKKPRVVNAQLYGSSAGNRRVHSARTQCCRSKSHPSRDEWRAEKLSEESLRDAFFGLSHKCTNKWVGGAHSRPVACHVGLWGDAQDGLEALRLQRACMSFATHQSLMTKACGTPSIVLGMHAWLVTKHVHAHSR